MRKQSFFKRALSVAILSVAAVPAMAADDVVAPTSINDGLAKFLDHNGASEWQIKVAQNLAQAGAQAARGNEEAAVSSLRNSAFNAVEATLEEQVAQAFERTEFSIEFEEDGKPTIGLLTVQPIYESDDLTDTVFFQGSVYRRDGRTTLNLGTGYRRLLWEEKLLAGVNMFYDHEWPYDHQRASVGAELRTTVAELNANGYMVVSGWQTGHNSQNEKGMDGFDVELGVPLPYLPRLKAYGKMFVWDAKKGVADLEGREVSLEGSVLPGLIVAAGQRDYDTRDSERFVELRFDVADAIRQQKSDMPWLADKAYSLDSMRDKRLEKVRRENLIITQNDFTAGVSGF